MENTVFEGGDHKPILIAGYQGGFVEFSFLEVPPNHKPHPSHEETLPLELVMPKFPEVGLPSVKEYQSFAMSVPPGV